MPAPRHARLPARPTACMPGPPPTQPATPQGQPSNRSNHTQPNHTRPNHAAQPRSPTTQPNHAAQPRPGLTTRPSHNPPTSTRHHPDAPATQTPSHPQPSTAPATDPAHSHTLSYQPPKPQAHPPDQPTVRRCDTTAGRSVQPVTLTLVGPPPRAHDLPTRKWSHQLQTFATIATSRKAGPDAGPRDENASIWRKAAPGGGVRSPM